MSFPAKLFFRWRSRVPIAVCCRLSLPVCFFFLFCLSGEAQPPPPSDSALPVAVPASRIWLVGGVHVAGYGGSLVLLNEAWYKDFPRTRFHTFNDSREWLQMDKLGHAWTVYNAGKASAALWKWAGLEDRKAALFGVLGSTAFMTGIEFLDGRSAKWGWSWSDIAANVAGSGIFLAQMMAWKEERISFKFSFHHQGYPDATQSSRANSLFGKTWYERMLKDYNGQTYWMSINLASFHAGSTLPPWLNLGVGYGADGMLGGFDNKWTDNLGNTIDRTNIPRRRQFYLAPDIDFTRIPTRKAWLRVVFHFLNAFKCPSPALMIDSKGKIKGHLLYF